MNINLETAFDTISEYSHMWNWSPDINLAKEIYNNFPNSYSVLTPFMYVLLEEIIRSTTSDYGHQVKGKKKIIGINLIKLAINENYNNKEYLNVLNDIKKYFKNSTSFDCGDNRNSVSHGYLHPRFWTQESFEKLVIDISEISKFSGF
jgi:hypothetical protein